MKPLKRPRLTVVSPCFPPQVTGSAILLANLLGRYPGDVNVIAGHDCDARSDSTFSPPCPVFYRTFPRRFPRLSDRLLRRAPGIVYHSLRHAFRRAFVKFGTNVVLGTYPDGVSLASAFLAARQLGLPFYAHMHDLWVENTQSGTALARFAETWEPLILRGATRVLCMTEAMQEHYKKKYNIQTFLLPHTIADQDLHRAPVGIRSPRQFKPTILFVGAVSPPMNLDALKILAAASELLPKEYELLFCTSLDLVQLERFGIRSSRLRAQYVTREEVGRLQAESLVLVAPLSHKHGSRDEVRTVFSTKLLEYLVAGRPIVVFAPSDSYHATAASKNEWGYVVTEDNPSALAGAIIRVANDEALAARLVQGALREAESRRATRHAAQLQEWVLKDVGHAHDFVGAPALSIGSSHAIR